MGILSTASETILDNILAYTDWDGVSGTPPRTVTINEKLEGPLYYWLDTNPTYPVVVIEPTRWPVLRKRELNQIHTEFDCVLFYVYKASPGENPHQIARQRTMDIMENIMESNRLGGIVDDISCTGVFPPTGELKDYLIVGAPGLGIASCTIAVTAVLEVTM